MTHESGNVTNTETSALLFFTSVRSGPARRMEGLLASIVRRERGWLRLVTVDADASRRLADGLGTATIPTLVLLHEQRSVGRIEGHASAPKIEAIIRRHRPGPLRLPDSTGPYSAQAASSN